MKNALAPPLRAIAWILAALLASYALTAWLRPVVVAAGVGCWWATVALVLVLAGFASPLVFLRKANEWAPATIGWRPIIVDVAGFLGTVAVCGSAALAVARWRGWL